MPVTSNSRAKRPAAGKKQPHHGGRLLQEEINYIVDRIVRVQTLFNQSMELLQPYFAIPSSQRDPDSDLNEMSKNTIDENDIIINEVIEKIWRKFREISRQNDGFRQSGLGRYVQQLNKLYFQIYRELWGGYKYYDDIGIEPQLRAFHAFVNRPISA